MKTVVRIVIILILASTSLLVKAQWYTSIGTNYSQIYLTPSIYHDHKTFNYGLGISIGTIYNHQFNRTLNTIIGAKYLLRNVKPIYDVSHYTEIYSGSLVIDNQHMLSIPISLRVQTWKNIDVITGWDFDIFLNTIDSKMDNRIDPNLNFGISYTLKKWMIDAGYKFSVTPYRENDGFNYKNRSFYLNLNYNLF